MQSKEFEIHTAYYNDNAWEYNFVTLNTLKIQDNFHMHQQKHICIFLFSVKNITKLLKTFTFSVYINYTSLYMIGLYQ